METFVHSRRVWCRYERYANSELSGIVDTIRRAEESLEIKNELKSNYLTNKMEMGFKVVLTLAVSLFSFYCFTNYYPQISSIVFLIKCYAMPERSIVDEVAQDADTRSCDNFEL